MAPDLIPGFKEYAHHIYDLDSCLEFKEAIAGFSGGNNAVGVSSTPFKCPAAPYECALLLNYHFTNKGLQGKFKIKFFTP